MKLYLRVDGKWQLFEGDLKEELAKREGYQFVGESTLHLHTAVTQTKKAREALAKAIHEHKRGGK